MDARHRDNQRVGATPGEQNTSHALEEKLTQGLRPPNVHFRPETSQIEAQDYAQSTPTPRSVSTISTQAYDDDIGNGIARHSLGVHQPDRSEDTLIGDEMTKWEPTEPPSEITPRPQKRTGPLLRGLRHRYLNAYQRLFATVLVGNGVALVVTMVQRRHAKPFGPRLEDVATATAANLTAAILMRQEYIINFLYDIMTLAPHSLPLRVRRSIAKFYHFGGVHSGSAVSALIWFTLYTVLVTKQFVDGTFVSVPVVVLTYCLITLLACICIFSIPGLRSSNHNTFEVLHRFGGWTAIALFWVQAILVSWEQSKIINSESFGLVIAKTPAFWFLVVVTVCIILPWIRLRKIQAWPEILSTNAARIHFNYKSIGKVVGIRIANHPLKEWHPFATIPEADGSSFSILVSVSGDWTKQQVSKPCYSYWVRGIPISGILRMACIFKKVVVVTTGSGIGPCLSLLIAHPLPCRILWSTRDPMKVYGPGTISAVMKSDPNAMIIDTKESGRPDGKDGRASMQDLTYHLYKESEAEAVFVVSNNELTTKLVYDMESRGVPAYGPIWDS